MLTYLIVVDSPAFMIICKDNEILKIQLKSLQKYKPEVIYKNAKKNTIYGKL